MPADAPPMRCPEWQRCPVKCKSKDAHTEDPECNAYAGGCPPCVPVPPSRKPRCTCGSPGYHFSGCAVCRHERGERIYEDEWEQEAPPSRTVPPSPSRSGVSCEYEGKIRGSTPEAKECDKYESCYGCPHNKQEAAPEPQRPVCRGCGNEIDPDTCHCGASREQGHDGHSFIPMGCTCGYAEPPEPKPAAGPACPFCAAPLRRICSVEGGSLYQCGQVVAREG